MASIKVEQIRERLEAVEARRRHYEWKSDQPGRLRRSEVWRHEYLARPYLLGTPDERVAERFASIFFNVTELGNNGQLTPVPLSITDEFTRVFTHMLEEYETRTGGMPPDEVVVAARSPLLKYFENETPIGVRMFSGYKPPVTPVLVKYGKREFLEPMLASGYLRLANAKLYNNTSFIGAVHDDETSRTFFIPTYNERLDGKTHIDFQGNRIQFDEDDIILPLTFGDYFLFSLCEHIHPRMPTDFDADAAIVIKDPVLFKQRLISTFLARYPGWEVMEGAVIYYDPYRDYTKFNIPEMAKHFGYAYQREVRVAFRPTFRSTVGLEPLFLSIGSMHEYADLVAL